MRAIGLTGSIELAGRYSVSQLFHSLLLECVAAWPETFGMLEVPEQAEHFRRGYPRFLPVFEAARLGSANRQEITQMLVERAQGWLVWRDGALSQPVGEHLAAPQPPLDLNVTSATGGKGWQPDIVYRGQRWAAPQLAELAQTLKRDDAVTAVAADSLRWVHDHLLANDALDLSARRIVVVGAGAEMAPTRLWLEAGADVLWLDVVGPPADWLASSLPGRLYWPKENANLLTQPARVLATIEAFAAEQPVDLGLYAYAPGQARELRLTGTMNAIVAALPPTLIASITMLVSPTTPAQLDETDLAAMRARRSARPWWEALLDRLGLLGSGGGAANVGGEATTRTIVGIQGASYQAAQYLFKVLVAETWVREGLRVSANTAAITRTRSLEHPVFAAAFGGASAMGVQTFTPRQSRAINGLLAVADWHQAFLPLPGRVRVHGGIQTLPYPLESALKVAAVLGFVRSPRLLRGLLR